MKIRIKTIGSKIISKIKIALIPVNWINFMKEVIKSVPRFIKKMIHFLTFFLVFIDFFVIEFLQFGLKIPLINKVCQKILNLWTSKINRIINAVINKIEKENKVEVDRAYLIFLALQNLKNKAGRSIITMLGMSVGVGIIVYLLSLGYGIERLVISQVASLNELKVIDVSASQNTSLQINKTAIGRIKKIKNIEKVIPLISLVGRINYNKAKTDVLVYAAPNEYLQASKVTTLKGKLFSFNDLSTVNLISKGQVAGETETIIPAFYNTNIAANPYEFNILPGQQAKVWSECNINSEVIGYVTRIEGNYLGQLMWGSSYSPFSNYGRDAYDSKKNMYLGRWIVAKVALFNKSQDYLIPQISDNGYQNWQVGCIPLKYIQLYPNKINNNAQVLGETTKATVLSSTTASTLSAELATSGVEATGSALPMYDATVVATDSSGMEFVQINSSESAKMKKTTSTIEFNKKTTGDAIISTGLMRLLGLKLNNVIGTEFDVSFIIVKNLMPEVEGRAFSSEVKYKVIGVVEDDENQYFYIPFSDMEILGVSNMSQLKVITKDKNNLSKIRSEIETIGYTTSSVVDTVSQIESLFATIRLVLAMVGLIALGVASLGMFNTLTVSLLERTREIGGMKTIGMVSNEILDLFLAEAMIMGLSGGVGGLILGALIGHVSSFLVSLISMSQGLGYLNLTYIPTSFVIFILALSFLVGMVTGLYPAKRAKQISALNALRYE